MEEDENKLNDSFISRWSKRKSGVVSTKDNLELNENLKKEESKNNKCLNSKPLKKKSNRKRAAFGDISNQGNVVQPSKRAKRVTKKVKETCLKSGKRFWHIEVCTLLYYTSRLRRLC